MEDAIFLAYDVSPEERCPACIRKRDVLKAIQRFPEGQFVALDGSTVVGMASTMRTFHSPYRPHTSWMEFIGDKGIRNHDPEGDWLYGVEMAVRPDYRRQGIGTRLYDARFELVRRLNLRGFYLVGMLMGYWRYADELDPMSYAEYVIAREIDDPTVTMQMNRGFAPLTIVPNYLRSDPEAGNTGVLLVWENPDYNP